MTENQAWMPDTLRSAHPTCGIWRIKLSKFRKLASDLHRVHVAAPAKRVTAEWANIAHEEDQ